MTRLLGDAARMTLSGEVDSQSWADPGFHETGSLTIMITFLEIQNKVHELFVFLFLGQNMYLCFPGLVTSAR